MDCKIKECASWNNCGILKIIGKQPKNSDSCSYFKSQKQIEKKEKKLAKQAEDLENARKRKKKS